MSNLSNTGTMIWFGEAIQPSTGTGANTDFTGLTSCSIITGTDTISLEVLKNGTVVAHFAISEIVAWNIDKVNYGITFDCTDQVDYTFYFTSLQELLNADSRINQIVNGANLLADCGPEVPLIRFNDFFYGALTSDVVSDGTTSFRVLNKSVDGVLLYGLVDIAGTFNRVRFAFKDSTNSRPNFYTPSQVISNHSVFTQAVLPSLLNTALYDTLYMQISNNEINWFDMIDSQYQYLKKTNGTYLDSASSMTRTKGSITTADVVGAFQGGVYFLNNLFLKYSPTFVFDGTDDMLTFRLKGTLQIPNPTNLDAVNGTSNTVAFDQAIIVPHNLYLVTQPILYIQTTGETIDLGEKMMAFYGAGKNKLGIFCIHTAV